MEDIFKTEMCILTALGFNVDAVETPYTRMLNYLMLLDLFHNKQVAQKAWNYLNDAYFIFMMLGFVHQHV